MSEIKNTGQTWMAKLTPLPFRGFIQLNVQNFSVNFKAVHKTGHKLILAEPGAKLNGVYYRNVLLTQYLLHVGIEWSSSGYFTFLRDSSPTHCE